ncbi:cytoglobin-1-like [Anastrepha obliqua]|uniref:cytoglobin-1-like n=1 Tax=Anastrepha obliqua TaxID=95512 RepID=UPI002409852A|nr:cytoglobin-1-like [Anastrepha obliqua]XP_054725152.1 cytoglobin-1-like [Anastrepha obliqua]
MALNAEDIVEIKKTWAIPVATPTDSGAAILLRFFTKFPSNLEKFPFRDVPLTELNNSARFRAHCGRIIKTFDQSISQLEEEGGLQKIQEIWQEIARSHVQRHHIERPAYFELRTAIVEVLTEACNLNERQAEAWNKLLDIVYDIIFKKYDELGAQ